jgi:uncharacterized protein (TIGR03066 family)
MEKVEKNAKVAWLRVAMVLPIALGALLCFAQGAACSSSSSSALVGEWQAVGDGGVAKLLVFFNADGTYGTNITVGNASECQVQGTYIFNGTSVTTTIHNDAGVSQSETVQVSISGNTLTVDSPDGGATELFTRVNSNATNVCP